VSQDALVSVSQPPNITSFQLAGSDGNFVDASIASILGGAGVPELNAKVSYTGLDMPVQAVLMDGSGSVLAQGTAPAGASQTQTQTVLLGAPIPSRDFRNQRFSVKFTNAFGQTQAGVPPSVDVVPEFVQITSLQFDSNGQNILAGIAYASLGLESLNARAFLNSRTLVLMVCDQATPLTSFDDTTCTIPIGAQTGPLDILVTAYETRSDGTVVAQDKQGIGRPATETLGANTSTLVGPMTITAANNASTTANQYPSDLGGDLGPINIGAAAGTAAFRSAKARPTTEFNAFATAGIAGTPAPPGSLVFLDSRMNFSPAVPNEQSQIVYSYAAADLPDDPGFNAANLELVSYDPGSGQLLTYPSTVNTNAQTVTATVSGIAPNFALAVPASTVGPELILPFDPQGMPAPGGFALFNAGTGPANTTLIARGGDGTALAAQPTTGATGPGQQISGALDSLGAASVTNPGWVQASASTEGTVGVALLANLSSLESLPLTPGSDTQVLTGIEMAAGESTQLAVANATPFENVVTLNLYNTSGTLVDTEQVNLEAKGSFVTTVEELFNAQAPLQGYVLVGGTERLSASAVTNLGNAVSALPGQPGLATATSLHAAYFQTGPSMAARLDIVNPGATAAPVTIQFNKADGTLLAKSITTTIAPGNQYWIDLVSTLGLSATQFSSGSISVTSNVAGLVGDATFGDTSAVPNFRTSIPLMPAQAKQAIPYVVNTTALPMSVYAANAGAASANVTFTLYGPASLAGTAHATIAVGGTLASALSTLIPGAAGQSGGALEIDSDQPLSVTGIIFPANVAADWAAIPAQPSSLVTPAAQYQLTTAASPAAGGSVTANPPSANGLYNPGTVVTVAAAANPGFQFTGWTGPVASASSASSTVTMNAAETVTANFTAAAAHPAFFNGENFLSGIVYYLQFPNGNLFGYYEYLSSSILYHFDMGYEAFIPGSGNQTYFYDFASGHWWYTSASLFPYLYDFTLNNWLYYFPATNNPGHYTANPRSFSDLTTGKIITM
jgi:hypothetical protein